jgi:hypothetical protein
VRLFVAFLSLFFSVVVLGAQGSSSLSMPPMGSLQYLEIREDLRRLFILGSPAQPGLLSQQRRCLERAYEHFKAGNQREELEGLLRTCVRLDLQLSDLDFEFERVTHEDPQWLQRTAESTWDLLPEDRRSFIDLRRRLALERSYREFILRYPIFAEALILPGWKFEDLSSAQELIFYSIENFDLSLVLEDLSDFDFFSDIFEKLHPASPKEDVHLAYARYLFFGRRLQKNLGSEEWQNEVQRIDLSWAHAWKRDLDFYELVWKVILKDSRALDWNSPRYFGSEKRSGLRWMYGEYRRAWSRFSSEFPILELSDQLDRGARDPRLALLPIEIDMLIEDSGLFSGDEITLFRRARSEVESGRWLNTKQEDSAFRQLSVELRYLMSSLLFPSLSVEIGASILDASFFHLPIEEFGSAAQKLVAALPEVQSLFDRLANENITKVDQRYEFVREVVRLSLKDRKLLDWEWIELDESKILLLDEKSILPSSARERDSMRSAMEEFSGSLNYGWYPEFLIQAFMIHLFPSEHYLLNESKKFWNELQRQQRLWPLKDLERELLQNSSIENSEELKEARTQLQQLFETAQGISRIDASSPGVLLACFVAGVKKNPWRIPLGVLSGSIVTFVFKWKGAQWMFVFVVGDTGLRFHTAASQNPNDLQWYELQLEKGTSSPVGRFFGEFLQDLMVTGKGLLDPAQDLDRIEAWYRSGELAVDFSSFAAGSALTQRILGGSSLSWRNAHAQRQASIRSIEARLQKLDSSSRRLLEEIHDLKARRLKLTADSSKEAKRLDALILEKERLRLRYEGIGFGRTPSLISFWARQTGRLLFRAGESILLLRPLPRWKDLRLPRLKEYWSRQSQVSRQDLEQALLLAESRLTPTDLKHWRSLSQAPLSAPESKALLKSRALALEKIDRHLSRYESKIGKSEDSISELQRLIQSIDDLLSTEELSFSAIQKMSSVESHPARSLNRYMERGIDYLNSILTREELFIRARQAALLQSQKSLTVLRALDARFRYRLHHESFEVIPSQIQQWTRIQARIELLSQKITPALDDALQKSTNSPYQMVSLRTYVSQVEQRLAPQHVWKIDSKSLSDLNFVKISGDDLPVSLQALKGEWTQAYSPTQSLRVLKWIETSQTQQIFILRKQLGEWRVIDRQFID